MISLLIFKKKKKFLTSILLDIFQAGPRWRPLCWPSSTALLRLDWSGLHTLLESPWLWHSSENLHGAGKTQNHLLGPKTGSDHRGESGPRPRSRDRVLSWLWSRSVKMSAGWTYLTSAGSDTSLHIFIDPFFPFPSQKKINFSVQLGPSWRWTQIKTNPFQMTWADARCETLNIYRTRLYFNVRKSF